MEKNLHKNLYIGLMSGTSMDAIDCALVDINEKNVLLIDAINLPIPENIYSKLNELVINNNIYDKNYLLNLIYQTDSELGDIFADAVLKILSKNNISFSEIKAIGSHGQTIFHNPNKKNGFTLQIGNPNNIAARTKINTIANFRNIDIAFGGQGAPLVPVFHKDVFMSNSKTRVIVNLGGIANISYLDHRNNKVIGFDTGPGNTLLDIWYQKNNPNKFKYDKYGSFAKSGKVNNNLLNVFLDDSYFYLNPPKSTGREYFNHNWLNIILKNFSSIAPEDVQRTLTELTAITISQQILKFCPNTDEVYFCGGGVHNTFLMQRIKSLINNYEGLTDELLIPADWVEAIAFAYFAYKNVNQIPTDLRSITGSSSEKCILGSVYYS